MKLKYPIIPLLTEVKLTVPKRKNQSLSLPTSPQYTCMFAEGFAIFSYTLGGIGSNESSFSFSPGSGDKLIETAEFK